MVRRVRAMMGVLAALALVVTFTGAAPTAAAASAPWHYPNPLVAVDRNGTQYVFWQGTNGGLWEAFNDGSWHGPVGLGQMGKLGSPPTAVAARARRP